MITWGLIAAATAFVYDKNSLYVARSVLGIAEAGFFPGIMLYLMRWFPREERAASITIFMIGNPICVIFGAPLSTSILAMDGLLGLAGWQWMFILQGLPAVILGVLTYSFLTERPEDAKWLEPEERQWLSEEIDAETRSKTTHSLRGALDVFRHGATLALGFSKFCVLLSFFGITLWLPQIVKSFGHLSNFETGLVTAIRYVFSAIGSIVIGRHSDRTGERALHIAIPAFLGTAGFVVAAVTGNPFVAMAALCVAATGLWVSNTIFWTIPAALLAGTPAAAGLALINSIGNLGGFFGPYFTGWIRAWTNSYSLALVMLGAFLALSGIIVLIVARRMPQARAALAAAE